MLKGEPVDRAPFCLYPHIDLELLTGESLAQLIEAFVERVEPDLVAVPFVWNYTLPANVSLDRPSDLANLTAVHARHGGWGEQIDALRRLCRLYHGKRPVVAVVPSAYRCLERLTSTSFLNEAQSGFLWGALEQLSRSLSAFEKAAVEVGCEGVLVEESGASHELWSPDVYRTKVLPLLQAQLQACKPAWTVVQFTGRRLFWEQLDTLETDGIGWPLAAGPGLVRGSLRRESGFVWGGLDSTGWPESSSAVLRNSPLRALSGDFPAKPVILAPPGGVQGLRLDQLEALAEALRRLPSPERLRETLAEREERLAARPPKPPRRKEAREPIAPRVLEAPKPPKGARTRLHAPEPPAESSPPAE